MIIIIIVLLEPLLNSLYKHLLQIDNSPTLMLIQTQDIDGFLLSSPGKRSR